MSAEIPSSAIVAITQNDRTASELKRLALLFDEILYLPPHGSILAEPLQNDRSRFKQVANGNWYIENFSWARDCVPGFSIPDHSLQGNGLSEVVCAFRNSGVMRPCQFAPEAWEPLPDDLVDIMHLHAAREMEEDAFLQNAGTDPSDFDRPMQMGQMGLVADDGTKRHTTYINPPAVINVSSILTMLAYYANKHCASPIMLGDVYQRGLSLRLSQIAADVNAVREAGFKLPAMSFPERFGAAVFRLSSVIFDDPIIDKLSVHEIVRLRKALKEPRRDFISTHLVALADLTGNDPWSDELREKIESYVRRELSPALRQYNEEGRSLWEQTIGKGVIRFSEVAATAATGGGVGGLAASLIPNSNFWGFLLLGAAAGALKTAPKVVSDLVDVFLALRKRRRNGLAYVREIGTKGM